MYVKRFQSCLKVVTNYSIKLSNRLVLNSEETEIVTQSCKSYFTVMSM